MLNQQIDNYKKVVLIGLLRLTITAGFVFIYLNYQRGLFLFATIEFIVTFVTIGMYYIISKTENQKTIESFSLAYTLMFFSAMMFGFSIDEISQNVFLWSFTIPMISYLLLGIRKGFIVTLVYYFLSVIILINNFNLDEYETISLANIVCAAIGFWALSHIYEKANLLTKQKLEIMAIYDELTGLHNRTMLTQIFSKAVLQAQKEKQLISFIALDLDLFKGINDQFGHVMGDKVLKIFSKILSDNLPKKTSAFRLGGEEFAIIFPCDSMSQAEEFAESIRLKTEKLSIEQNGQSVKVTVSAGIAITNPEQASLTNMLKQSDKRLYQAKRNGRNKVIYQ